MIQAGIFGATGYTGIELVKLLTRHRQVQIVFASSPSSAGQTLADLYPALPALLLVSPEQAAKMAADVVFFCLPHGEAAQHMPAFVERGQRVVDLSADFRLKSEAQFEQWYEHVHPCPHLLAQFQYGLPELYRSEIAKARLVANPGCYPTSVLLALAPLLKAKMVANELPVIIDSKSGVTGAGRKATLGSHFVEVNENIGPYNVGRRHRHVPEMEQEIEKLGGVPRSIVFSPHLVPISQGLLSTLYVPLTQEFTEKELRSVFHEHYAREQFVRVVDKSSTCSSLRFVAGTNSCVLSVHSAGKIAIVVSAIDNLYKGASGQAVQNMNVMFGFEESEGLQ